MSWSLFLVSTTLNCLNVVIVLMMDLNPAVSFLRIFLHYSSPLCVVFSPLQGGGTDCGFTTSVGFGTRLFGERMWVKFCNTHTKKVPQIGVGVFHAWLFRGGADGWVSGVFVLTDARRPYPRSVIGSTVGAYPRGTGSNPVEGNGHFFPSYRQLYLSTFSDTHARTYTPTQLYFTLHCACCYFLEVSLVVLAIRLALSFHCDTHTQYTKGHALPTLPSSCNWEPILIPNLVVKRDSFVSCMVFGAVCRAQQVRICGRKLGGVHSLSSQ